MFAHRRIAGVLLVGVLLLGVALAVKPVLLDDESMHEPVQYPSEAPPTAGSSLPLSAMPHAVAAAPQPSVTDGPASPQPRIASLSGMPRLTAAHERVSYS